MLRRANSEAEARKIFAQAEAALDTERAMRDGADIRAAQTIRMLSEEYLRTASSAANSLAWWNYPVPPEDELGSSSTASSLNYLASLIGKPKAL